MYYPYQGSKAGTLRSKKRTAQTSEYLSADTEIISLAKEVLTEQEYLEAEELARKLVGTRKEKDLARARLTEIVKPPPKRPIYYAQYEMKRLPRWTRDAPRYLGYFIDILVKTAVYEKTHRQSIFQSSLGPAINEFEKCRPDSRQLADLLRKYNRFLYRGAKHDFYLPIGREMHRFTPREVVLTAFVTMDIADRITAISPLADRVRKDGQIS